jgi:hypothetical protein
MGSARRSHRGNIAPIDKGAAIGILAVGFPFNALVA